LKTGERDYHFEDMVNKFTINIDENTNLAHTVQEMETVIHISPSCEDPVLEHYMSVEAGDKITPISLELNGDVIDINEYLKPVDGEPGKYKFAYPLSQKITGSDGKRIVKYRRVIAFVQDLSIDPLFGSNLTRYIKGYSVIVNMKTEGYKTLFKRYGVSGDSNPKPEKYPEGGVRWRLANNNDLLLPGESHILVIIKEGI
jgi:hypothetical protein